MKKLKILQFPIGNTKSGITQYVLENWRFIDKARFHFDFVTMSSELNFEDKLKRTSSKVYKIKKYAEIDEQSFYDSFYKILKESNYDIVHLHTSQWKNLTAERAAKDAKIPRIIIHAHNAYVQVKNSKLSLDELYNRHASIRESLTLDLATDYWACSKLAAEFLYGNKIPQDMIKIMNDAIDVDKFIYCAESRQEIRQEFCINKSDFLIGHVGRFVHQKNQEFILKVAKLLKDNNINFKLMLVGEGANMKDCQKYVNDNKLNDMVIFTGYREDVNKLFSAFDLFVLPSRFEGLGIVLIEAQAAGLKCISSDNIPPEAKVTNHLEFLPLIENEWYDKIKQIIKRTVKKFDTKDQITLAGYNIREQIKVLEQAYLNG